jgi:uncharacterized membrane protein
MTVSKTTLLLVAVAAILMMQHYYPLMPDPMASHFDGAGRPNGYQSREGFFLLSGAMLLLVVAIFGGAGFVFRVVPTNLFNLPNREYWLAPERRAATMEFMTRQMEWFGVVTLILLIGVLWAAMEANLRPDPVLDSSTMWWMMGAYLAFTTVWLVRFVLRFRTSSG